MKKVFKGIFISIYILLFFILLGIFNNLDNENIYSKFGFNKKYENFTIAFKESLTNEEKREIIDKVYRLKNEKDLVFEVAHFNTYEDTIIGVDYYISSNDKNIDEMIPIDNSITNFDESDAYYSTKKEEDSRKIKIFSFYNDKYYSLIPFHRLEENLDLIKYDLLAYNTSNLDMKEFKELLDDEFNKYNVNIGKYSGGEYNFIEDLRIKIYYISIVSFFISALFILYSISSRLKEISILK